MPTNRTKPPWLKIRLPGGKNYVEVKKILRAQGLCTVCEEARCPNIDECWGGGTATFMILGDVCTRHCLFCAVSSGDPQGKIDKDEPVRVSRAIEAMKLKYAVITSVTRDDLPDQGAVQFASTIQAVRQNCPQTLIECLIPDFHEEHLTNLLRTSPPDVLAHNIEVVPRLVPVVRDPRASYVRSLSVLENASKLFPQLLVKSSIIVGLGETEEEVISAMKDLRSAGVSLITIGQYLKPSPKHFEVQEFVPPEKFQRYKEIGEDMGFCYVASGPLIRSSYKAGEFFVHEILSKRDGKN